jgi:acetyl-CoA carboxylase beta subunit
MNWLTNVVRPKIRNILRRETPENLWIKCPDSGQLVFYKDVEANQFVIPGSNYHMRMGAVARLKSIFDNETWFDVALPEVTADPLKFRDERKYADRIKDARARTGLKDAIKVGYGKLEGAAWLPGKRSCAGLSSRSRRNLRSSCSRPPVAPACRKAFCHSCRCRARLSACKCCAR